MPYSALHQLISERIQREGPISFAEYMRMALYEPGYGYYMSGAAKMGWEADYFTSTDVSSLFANCMARQLYAMWEKLKRPAHFIVLEQGAGRGHLSEGVRTWAQKEVPEFYAALDYRSEDIRAGQDALGMDRTGETGQPTTAGRSQGQPPRGRPRHDDPGGLTSSDSTQGDPGSLTSSDSTQGDPGDLTSSDSTQGDPGSLTSSDSTQGDPRVPTPRNTTPAPTRVMASVVLSNELIDAFPVYIVEKRGEQLYEVFVDAQQDGRLYEVLDEPSTPEVASYLDTYKIPWRTFDEGWRAEINLDALRWMQRTAGLVGRGFLLTIDYGDKARALYTAWRKRGTLLCYFKHQSNELPLLHPGEQDITSHVNFSALINEGRRLGMRLHAFTTQRLWLQSMGILEELEQRRVNEFAEAETARATDQGQVALLKWRDLRNRAAMLTNPDGMGDFKVLIMRR
jgi:SAM-dependent MidA family methyltransferase